MAIKNFLFFRAGDKWYINNMLNSLLFFSIVLLDTTLSAGKLFHISMWMFLTGYHIEFFYWIEDTTIEEGDNPRFVAFEQIQIWPHEDPPPEDKKIWHTDGHDWKWLQWLLIWLSNHLHEHLITMLFCSLEPQKCFIQPSSVANWDTIFGDIC